MDDLYQSVTHSIIKQMEAGVIPWTQPWQTNGAAYVPTNMYSGAEYNGINILILWISAIERGYRSHGWMGFEQAKKIGAHVRKGERSTRILFFKTLEKEDDNGDTITIPMPKYLRVFHVEQLENLPQNYRQVEEPPDKGTVYKEAYRLITESGIKFEFHHPHAAYAPSRDVIEMPPVSSFESEEEFFGVAFHELVHSSGAPKRLNRDLTTRFKSEKYGMEELTAELGSAFLCARTGIPARHRSPAYVDHWLKVLKADNKAIFTAASHAAKAADYCWETVHYAENENTPDVERQANEQTAVAV